MPAAVILKLWYKSLFCRGGINCLSLQQPAELSQRLHVLALWQLLEVSGVASERVTTRANVLRECHAHSA
jgi:hypothetical protein